MRLYPLSQCLFEGKNKKKNKRKESDDDRQSKLCNTALEKKEAKAKKMKKKLILHLSALLSFFLSLSRSHYFFSVLVCHTLN